LLDRIKRKPARKTSAEAADDADEFVTPFLCQPLPSATSTAPTTSTARISAKVKTKVAPLMQSLQQEIVDCLETLSRNYGLVTQELLRVQHTASLKDQCIMKWMSIDGAIFVRASNAQMIL
jgi:hypothetical protein